MPARRSWFVKLALAAFGVVLGVGLGGCAVVPQNRRATFADPMMKNSDEALDAHRQRKLYTTREAAAGGDGKRAGGGCSCQ